MARSDVRGPVLGGETLSSIGPELAETPHCRIFSEDPVGLAVAPIGGAAKQRARGRDTETTMARTEVRGPVLGGETLSSIGHELVEIPRRRIFSEDSVGRAVVPFGGAAKQRPRGRAIRATVARTEVRGPVNGGETLSSIGNEFVETPPPQDF